MTDFDEQLKRAIQRGKVARSERAEQREEQQSQSDAARRKHQDARLALAEYIERALRKLVDHFPGFSYETIFGDRGWGGAIFRDDVSRRRGPANKEDAASYSRLELVVRPPGPYQVVDLLGKATVRNKELFARNIFEPIDTLDLSKFRQTIDLWVLEFAEKFSMH
jgi:hypothetical protein